MQIDPTVTGTSTSASPLNGGAQRTAQGEASTQGANAPATPTAQTSTAQQNVNLSTLATQLRALGAGVTTASGDIDTKRVSEIKDAISKGKLSFDSSKIADGLIESVRGLLQTPQGSS